MENTSPIPNMSLPQTSSAASNGNYSGGSRPQTPITSPSPTKAKETASNNVKGKDLFNRSHNPSHSTLYPDVLKIKTIIVEKQNF